MKVGVMIFATDQTMAMHRLGSDERTVLTALDDHVHRLAAFLDG